VSGLLERWGIRSDVDESKLVEEEIKGFERCNPT